MHHVLHVMFKNIHLWFYKILSAFKGYVNLKNYILPFQCFEYLIIENVNYKMYDDIHKVKII